MAPKKLVLKTSISCSNCKTTILQAITKLEGIDEVSIDDDKETVTVIGNVDPTKVVKNLKKARKHVKIETLGPHKKEEPKKKEEEKNTILPHCCDRCAYGYEGKHHVIIEEIDHQPSCSIQ